MSSSEPCTGFRVRRPDEGRRPASLVGPGCVVLLAAVLLVNAACAAEIWRALTVAPEHRCSPYDRKRDYPYPQSVEREIVHRLGAIYGPYTGTCFGSTSETDIEHIVAASEAHDSGLCARDRATRARFATDLRNLTLASPQVNRHSKGRQGPCRMATLPKPVLVRRPRRGGPPRLRSDDRPARSGGLGTGPCRMREHSAGALRVRRKRAVQSERRIEPERRRRCTRTLRRQSQRQDHMRRGASASNRTCPPDPSGLPVHA